MAALALTVLLVVAWLAFVALGYWHGGWRQVVLLAGMLLSYAVLSEWAAPNGRDLATQFHWSVARATTTVALLYLLGGTLALGFLGSFALDRPRPLGAWERQCGAAMGLLNGGVLLALVLRTLRSYAYVAGGGRALRTAALSRFLIESIGYVLLAALLLGLVAAGMGFALARRRAPDSLPVSEATGTQAVALPPPMDAPEAQIARSAVALPPHRVQLDPVYAAEPVIDWPTTPPPGTRVDPVVAARPAAASPEPVRPGAKEAEAVSPIPAVPVAPRRVEPPMWYPVAELVAERVAPQEASPLSDAIVPAASAPAARPATPPPGMPDPASILPAAAQPPLLPEAASAPDDAPPVIRELDVATRDAPPIIREVDVTTQEPPPPVVRELDVTTEDAPILPEGSVAPSVGRPPAAEGEALNSPDPAPVPAIPTMPGAMTETTPIPTVVPPPLPPLPARRADLPSAPPPALSEGPAQEAEAAKPRARAARVAVARQPGQRLERPPAPQPVPQPPGEPDPLQPPLPTGPRVHPCPTCGYPVRDHARYCPNCGSRQRP